jgi:hypothetical protein
MRRGPRGRGLTWHHAAKGHGVNVMKWYLELLSDGSRRSTHSASPHTRLSRFVLNPLCAASASYSDSTRRRSLAP